MAPPELCPLVGLTATNYKAASSRIHVLFTQAMASRLDVALEILAKRDITVQINLGFRTIAENAAPRSPGAANSNHLVGDAADIHFDGNWTAIQAAMHSAGLVQGTGTETHHFQLFPWGQNRDSTPRRIAACSQEHPDGT